MLRLDVWHAVLTGFAYTVLFACETTIFLECSMGKLRPSVDTIDNHVRALLYFQRGNPCKTRSLRWYAAAFVGLVG